MMRWAFLLCLLSGSIQGPAQTEWTTFTSDNWGGQPVNICFADSRGNFWIGTKDGAGRYSDERWTLVRSIEDLDRKTEEPVGNVIRFWEDRFGKIYVAGEGRLSIFDGEAWEYYRDRYNPGFTVRFLLNDSRQEIWLCSEKREINRYENLLSKPLIHSTLARLGSSAWISYGMEAGGSHYVQAGDPEEYYTGILEDRRGYIWITSVEGVYIYAGDGWLTLHDETLPNAYATGLTTDDRGNVWVATLGGVAMFDGADWKVYRKSDGLGGNMVRRIVAGSDGSIWAYVYGNTDFAGLSRYADGKWSFFSSGKAIPGALPVSGTDYLCRMNSFMTRNGFAFFDGSEWIMPGQEQGIDGKRFYGLGAASDGTLWICTDEGLFSGDGRHFTRRQTWGLPGWEPGAMLCDSKDRVWVAGKAGGLIVLEKDYSRFFGPENGLTVEKPLEIVEDRMGRIWVTGSKEVAVFDDAQ